MSVGLYADEQVRSAVVDGLRARGVDVLTVQEDGLTGAPDVTVLDRAMALGRVVFTQDVDFLIESARRQRAIEPFAGVVYGHQRGVAVSQCIDDLEAIALASDADEWAGRVQYLPL